MSVDALPAALWRHLYRHVIHPHGQDEVLCVRRERALHSTSTQLFPEMCVNLHIRKCGCQISAKEGSGQGSWVEGMHCLGILACSENFAEFLRLGHSITSALDGAITGRLCSILLNK